MLGFVLWEGRGILYSGKECSGCECWQDASCLWLFLHSSSAIQKHTIQMLPSLSLSLSLFLNQQAVLPYWEQSTSLDFSSAGPTQLSFVQKIFGKPSCGREGREGAAQAETSSGLERKRGRLRQRARGGTQGMLWTEGQRQVVSPR